ncbi:MAG: hypothetical protein ABFD92_15540 [Planctomycetaceae bacterium]|nr:hypothetical protein [Planctomycetaceae bacterium]
MTESHKESGARPGSPSPSKQKLLLVVGGIIAAAVLAIWFIYFVTRTEEGPNKARAGVMAAVDSADALYHRALGLLSSPVYEDIATGKPGPYTVDGDPVVTKDTIRLRPPGAVNPQAIEALTQAKAIIEKGLADNAEADASVKAIAHHVNARVLWLRGFYFDQKALNQRWDAQRGASGIDRMVSVLQAQSAFLAQYDKMLNLPDGDVRQIMETTQAELTDVEKEHEAASKQIIYLGNEVASLRDQIATLSQKARESRTQSRLVNGPKSLEMVEQAIADEAQIRQIEGKIATNQDQVQQLLEQRRMLGVRINSGRGKIKAAQDMLAHRKEQLGRRSQQREDCLKLINESQQAIVKEVSGVNKAAQGAKADEAEAMKEYADSQKELDQSFTQAQATSAEALAEKGNVLARVAGLQSTQAVFARRLLALKTSIAEVWSKTGAEAAAPDEVGQLGAYLADPEATANESLKNYDEVIRNYQLAIQSLQDNEKVYRWMYQGELAAAYLGYSQVKNDPDKLRKANEIITDALKDKEASPYLRPVVRLRDSVAAATTQPTDSPAPKTPATAPEVSPAAPEAPPIEQ